MSFLRAARRRKLDAANAKAVTLDQKANMREGRTTSADNR
jgi:hypothetical protein